MKETVTKLKNDGKVRVLVIVKLVDKLNEGSPDGKANSHVIISNLRKLCHLPDPSASFTLDQESDHSKSPPPDARSAKSAKSPSPMLPPPQISKIHPTKMKKDTDKIIHDRPEEEDEPEDTERKGTSQSKKPDQHQK